MDHVKRPISPVGQHYTSQSPKLIRTACWMKNIAPDTIPNCLILKPLDKHYYSSQFLAEELVRNQLRTFELVEGGLDRLHRESTSAGYKGAEPNKEATYEQLHSSLRGGNNEPEGGWACDLRCNLGLAGNREVALILRLSQV
jgi:hypothetical protein